MSYRNYSLILASLFGLGGLMAAAEPAMAGHNWRVQLAENYRFQRDSIRRDFNEHEDHLRHWYERVRDTVNYRWKQARYGQRGEQLVCINRDYLHQRRALDSKYRQLRKKLNYDRDAAYDQAKDEYYALKRRYEHQTRYGVAPVLRRGHGHAHRAPHP